MKMVAGLLSLLLSLSTFAGEFTGADAKTIRLLRENNVPVEQLQRTGHEFMRGEFTGAGRTVDVSRIKHVITTNQVVPAKDIDAVETTNNQEIPVRSSQDLRRLKVDFNKVKKIEAYGDVIRRNQVKGLIYR